MPVPKADVRAAIAYLSTGVAVRCNVMIRLLTGLGFTVKPVYVASMRSMLASHADDLQKLHGGQK